MKTYLNDPFYEYNELTFIERFNKAEKLKPLPFVWHVSNRNNRASIFQNGLVRPTDHAVFANNVYPTVDEIMGFDPIFIDIIDESDSINDLMYSSWDEFVEVKYDFWRIDTTAFEADWRINPKTQSVKSICIMQSIPSKFIQLFKYKSAKTEFIESVVGAVSIINRVAGLYPVLK